MTKDIILNHLKFLEMFKWFMSKEILTTKHKTPIQYTSENKARSAYHRVLRKGIKLLFAKYGFRTSVFGRQINFRLTPEQHDNTRANNITSIVFKKIQVNYSTYGRSGWINMGRFSFAEDLVITEFLDDLRDDLKELARISKSKPILKVKEDIKPRKTQEQKEEIKTQEQNLFNNAWRRQNGW